MNVNKFGAKAILFFGLVFSVIGLWQLRSNYTSISKGIKVRGTVVGFKARIPQVSKKTANAYAPIVEFTLPNGLTERAPASLSAAKSFFKIGETVEGYVNPRFPRSIILDTFFRKWGIGFLFMLIGFGPFVLGLKLTQKEKIRSMAINHGKKLKAVVTEIKTIKENKNGTGVYSMKAVFQHPITRHEYIATDIIKTSVGIPTPSEGDDVWVHALLNNPKIHVIALQSIFPSSHAA